MRLRNAILLNDTRVEMAIASLSSEEIKVLKDMAQFETNQAWGFPDAGVVNFLQMNALPRLLDKGIIKTVAQFEEGHPAYSFTRTGKKIAMYVKSGLPMVKADKIGEKDAPA